MNREGKCNFCGACCIANRDWGTFLEEIQDQPKERTSECPNLLPDNGNGERKCAIYKTEHHWFWETHCHVAPAREKDPFEVVKWFEANPECSLEYIED